jgi:hypothetical protein
VSVEIPGLLKLHVHLFENPVLDTCLEETRGFRIGGRAATCMAANLHPISVGQNVVQIQIKSPDSCDTPNRLSKTWNMDGQFRQDRDSTVHENVRYI